MDILEEINSYYISKYNKNYVLARDLQPLIRDRILKFIDYNERNDPTVDYTHCKILILKSQKNEADISLNNIPNFPNRGLIFIDSTTFNIFNNRKRKEKESVLAEEDPVIYINGENIDQVFDMNILNKSIDKAKARIEDLNRLSDEHNHNSFESNYVDATNQINTKKRNKTKTTTCEKDKKEKKKRIKPNLII